MAKHKNVVQATVVAPQATVAKSTALVVVSQPVCLLATVAKVPTPVVAAVQVVTNAMARMVARIAAVQRQRAAKHAQRGANRKHSAFMLQVAQVSAQYGYTAAQAAQAMGLQAVPAHSRANIATANPSASSIVIAGQHYKPTHVAWVLANAMVAAGQQPTSASVKAAAVALGQQISASTVGTQFSHWQHANQATRNSKPVALGAH